ncbi:MAG TPA: hypothetical protein PLD27_11585 [bacterium]|nr:hypothetical protein [bacterium]HOL48802.1 hypothetical protein [bacterium]HPQ19935.1 hypothetical protein [bacterium]
MILIVKYFYQAVPVKSLEFGDIKISLYIIPNFKTKDYNIKIRLYNISFKPINIELSKNNFSFIIKDKEERIIYETNIFENTEGIVKEIESKKYYEIEFQIYKEELKIVDYKKFYNISFRYKNNILTHSYKFLK